MVDHDICVVCVCAHECVNRKCASVTGVIKKIAIHWPRGQRRGSIATAAATATVGEIQMQTHPSRFARNTAERHPVFHSHAYRH